VRRIRVHDWNERIINAGRCGRQVFFATASLIATWLRARPWPQICLDLVRAPSVNTLRGELSLMNSAPRGVNMSYSTTVAPAIPAGGVTAFGYGREDAPSGLDDFLETQSLFLGPDRASEKGDAR
jgi:hypothetical protein